MTAEYIEILTNQNWGNAEKSMYVYIERDRSIVNTANIDIHKKYNFNFNCSNIFEFLMYSAVTVSLSTVSGPEVCEGRWGLLF